MKRIIYFSIFVLLSFVQVKAQTSQNLLCLSSVSDNLGGEAGLIQPATQQYEMPADLFSGQNSYLSSSSAESVPPTEYYDFQMQNQAYQANNRYNNSDRYNNTDKNYQICEVRREYGLSSRSNRPTFRSYLHDFIPYYDGKMNESREQWDWHLLPDNIIYKSYMACGREPRLGIHFIDSMQPDNMSYWDCSIGARVSLIRFGTNNPLYPEGFELEMDACAFPRLTLDSHRDLWSCDYRFAFPLAYRKGHWEYMFGYYHISSHLGDENMVRNNSLQRLNYVRDCLMLGVGYRPNLDWRFYFNAEWAFYIDDGAKPWQFIFGFEYSPMNTHGCYGAPFLAMCARLRQDIDFSGSLTLEAGWQWRTKQSHVFRTGLFYLNGASDHYQFYDVFEQEIGVGFWYDF